jgi:hypothetical protein
MSIAAARNGQNAEIDRIRREREDKIRAKRERERTLKSAFIFVEKTTIIP